MSHELEPHIQQSWKRSKQYNIDADLKNSPINMNEANRRFFIKANQFLIEQSSPHLKKLVDSMDSESLIITLANHDAEVLANLGKNLSSAEAINLIPGSRWSEEDCGTNGIGTAVSESKALSIFGHEHYCHSWHELLCTSSPIKDPFTQKMLGTITLSGQKDFVPLHNIALVQSMAKMIENSIYDHIQFSIASNYLQYFRSNKPIVIFDEYFQIKYVNLEAVKLLHLTSGEYFHLFPGEVNLMTSLTISNQYRDFKGKLWKVSAHPFTINNRVLGRIAVFEKSTSVASTSPKKSAPKPISFDNIITENNQTKQLKLLADQYAKSDLNVLITGETGTGKELFAKAIHHSSERKKGPFVVVNCGAIPKELIASELFGYVEGAFTHAARGGKEGKFRAAHSGTIFLDEIGELPIDLQPYLLRILEEKKVYPLGTHTAYPIDVRIIAATNKDLKSAITAGSFRDDLYYRLNILHLNMLPLRERKEDIPFLFAAFLKEQKYPLIQVKQEVLELLKSYDWLGNIRELRNCFHKILFHFQIRNKGNIISIQDIPEEYRSPERKIAPTIVEEVAPLTIEKALIIAKGNKSKAADYLGISRTTLYRKLGKKE
ncbi:MAG: sigma-54-dependent Fis family transcriptional regulator [Bacteroidota bacterium]